MGLDSLPNILGLFGAIVDFLGTVLEVVKVEFRPFKVRLHGLEADIIGLVRVERLAHNNMTTAILLGTSRRRVHFGLMLCGFHQTVISEFVVDIDDFIFILARVIQV